MLVEASVPVLALALAASLIPTVLQLYWGLLQGYIDFSVGQCCLFVFVFVS